MEEKKTIFVVIFLMLVLLVTFSGCISPDQIPVATVSATPWFDGQCVTFRGSYAYPFCKAKNAKFVYDNVSHENWTEYKYSINAPVHENVNHFSYPIDSEGVEHYITYYYRAVAYCYDFKGPLRNLGAGYYEGVEKTFEVEWD